MTDEQRARLARLTAQDRRERLERLAAHYSDEMAYHCNLEDADAMQWALDTISVMEMERDRTAKEHDVERQQWRWSSEQVQTLAAQVAEARAEATKERQDSYAQVNTLCDQITALRKERDAIEAERRVLLHEHTLALERSKRGVTDCSTPLHRRIENIVDALAKAEAERNTLREQLRREQDACDVCAEAADKYRNEAFRLGEVRVTNDRDVAALRNELELMTQEHDKLKNIADAHRAAIAGLRACDELRAQAVHDVEKMATALEEGTWSAPTIDSVPAIRALVKENMVLRHMEDMAREREVLLAQAEQAAMLHRRAYLEEHDKLAALMNAQNRDRC